jgi:hypothetical protein
MFHVDLFIWHPRLENTGAIVSPVKYLTRSHSLQNYCFHMSWHNMLAAQHICRTPALLSQATDYTITASDIFAMS